MYIGVSLMGFVRIFVAEALVFRGVSIVASIFNGFVTVSVVVDNTVAGGSISVIFGKGSTFLVGDEDDPLVVLLDESLSVAFLVKLRVLGVFFRNFFSGDFAASPFVLLLLLLLLELVVALVLLLFPLTVELLLLLLLFLFVLLLLADFFAKLDDLETLVILSVLFSLELLLDLLRFLSDGFNLLVL